MPIFYEFIVDIFKSSLFNNSMSKRHFLRKVINMKKLTMGKVILIVVLFLGMTGL